MKKAVSILIALIMIFTFLPTAQVEAFNNGHNMGTIESGVEYYGTLPKNDGGNSIPVRYELPVTENCMVRIIVYTQAVDTNVYIESEDGPYNLDDSYGRFRGNNLTAVYDFYNPNPNTFSSSNYCCDADSRNTNPYTEVYGDLAAGNYHVTVTGDTYRFKIILEPLRFKGTTAYTNSTMASAANYTVGTEQEGVLLTNGAVNKAYYTEEQETNAWYKFTATKGKYQLKLTTDGFFQGSATVVDTTGYPFQGSYDKAEASMTYFTGDQIAATFEDHVGRVGQEFTTDIEIPQNGTYYVHIYRRMWTSGSYKFQLLPYNLDGSVEEGEDTGEDGNTDEAEVTINSVRLSQTSVKVKASSTSSLKAFVAYSDYTDEDMTDFVTWTTSDKKVATVSDQGIVKGVAAGTATITASIEGKKASVTVTVTASEELKKLVPAKATVYLKVGGTATNKITAYYADGNKKAVTANAAYKTSSSSLSISSKGLLKATAKGTYTVTATYSGKKTTFKVVVK